MSAPDAVKTSSWEPAPSADGVDRFTTLSTEILTGILLAVDNYATLANLREVNKALERLCLSSFFAAKWHLQTYSRHQALFRLGCRSRLFTPNNFDDLIRQGAYLYALHSSRQATD